MSVVSTQKTVVLPASTASPFIFAFGVTLLFAGLVTTLWISLLGAVLSIIGGAGWFMAVVPREQHESLSVGAEKPAVVTTRLAVERIAIAPGLHRPRLPLEIYPVSAGVKGGIAGGVAMAVLAMLYGILSGNGIWYPVNLLAAGFFPSATTATTAAIGRFYPGVFVIALTIHVLTSLLVGLLYGAALPMLPRRPIVLGGFIAPLLWSGLLHSILGIINPVLNQRIDWFWFVLSQVGFGVVAGIVVSHQERVRTWQSLPFLMRAGLEAPGFIDHEGEEDDRQ